MKKTLCSLALAGVLAAGLSQAASAQTIYVDPDYGTTYHYYSSPTYYYGTYGTDYYYPTYDREYYRVHYHNYW